MIIHHLKRYIELIILMILVLVVIWLYKADFGKNIKTEFGVTFSQKYVTSLNLDWHKMLIDILDELKVKDFRLVAYWDLIELNKDNYNFADLDWQINEIAKRDGKIILTIGQRVPRWPECHWPEWIYQVTPEERQVKVEQLIKEVVLRYKDNQNIIAWQVDNEPFLAIFGECPRPDKKAYLDEVVLVRNLDTRPVIVTESGELTTWLTGARIADYLGVSLYRITWNKWFGYFHYPIPPAGYYLKAELIKKMTGIKTIFISELQLEPWLGMSVLQTPIAEQMKSMSLDQFEKNVVYAKATGLSPIYTWGVEWWSWMKEQGDPSFWEASKELFN